MTAPDARTIDLAGLTQLRARFTLTNRQAVEAMRHANVAEQRGH